MSDYDRIAKEIADNRRKKRVSQATENPVAHPAELEKVNPILRRFESGLKDDVNLAYDFAQADLQALISAHTTAALKNFWASLPPHRNELDAAEAYAKFTAAINAELQAIREGNGND